MMAVGVDSAWSLRWWWEQWDMRGSSCGYFPCGGGYEEEEEVDQRIGE